MLFQDHDRILFIGDSISDYDRKRPVGEGLFEGLGTSYVSDIACHFGCTYPDMMLHFINMGISGNQVRDLDKRWQTDVLDLKPDWVSVLIGINDVWRRFDSPTMANEYVPLEEYRQTYESLIGRTLPHVKGMILMSPYFMEPNRQDAMRAEMDKYGYAVRELAEKYSLPFVDLQAGWDELFRHMHPCNIAWDRIHPNRVGHTYIAKQFLKAVGYEW